MGRTPDDPNNEPTQMADYEHGRGGGYDEPGYYSEYRTPTGQQPGWSQPPEPPPSTPWYFRPVALIGLGVLTALLIALLVWGMVRLVHQESGSTTPSTTSVPSSATAPTDESIPPTPQPVAPETTTADNPPPATTTEPPTTTTTTSEPPTTTTTTTEAPSTTTSSTSQPSSSATAPSTTTAPPQVPSEIVIPLPPGL